MGILDSVFDLPRAASSIGTQIQNAANSAVSFVTASAQTKISEAASSISNVLGASGGPLSKLGANLPSFDQLKASAMKAGSTLLGGTGDLVGKQIGLDNDKLAGGPSALQLKSETGSSGNITNHLYTLTEIKGGERVVQFDVMPEVTENHTISYEAVAPAQSIGAFQKFKGTESTTWNVNATFIARNSDEATQVLYYLNTLRGWTMPFFGDNTGSVYEKQLGAPPPVLLFKGLRNVVGEVPVVLTSVNWVWPNGVDYIPSTWTKDGDFVPCPTVITVALSMVESYSTTQFNRFSLMDYRHGDMSAAFNTPIEEQPRTMTAAAADSSKTATPNVATQADVRRIDNAIEVNSRPSAGDIRKFENQQAETADTNLTNSLPQGYFNGPAG